MACFVFILIVFIAGYVVFTKLRAQRATRAFLAAFRSAKAGDKAAPEIIPRGLHTHYLAEEVMGRGAFGCVVRARAVKGDYLVAVKLIVPEKGAFEPRELRQLTRESMVLQLFTASKCDHAVRLAGVESVCIKPEICWFVMENLVGDNMETVIYDKSRGPISDLECIRAARNVLAALKAITVISFHVCDSSYCTHDLIYKSLACHLIKGCLPLSVCLHLSVCLCVCVGARWFVRACVLESDFEPLRA